jgi:uncharacterized membrane protein YeaQ/YmgE (transglycosylase-associated protein family)
LSAGSYIQPLSPGLGVHPATASNGSLDRQDIKELHMNILIWLIVGGVIGWLASLIMRTDGQQGILLNVVVGIVGAFIGGWLISPLVGVGTINSSGINLGTVLVSLAGAVILLALLTLFRRGRTA